MVHHSRLNPTEWVVVHVGDLGMSALRTLFGGQTRDPEEHRDPPATHPIDGWDDGTRDHGYLLCIGRRWMIPKDGVILCAPMEGWDDRGGVGCSRALSGYP